MAIRAKFHDADFHIKSAAVMDRYGFFCKVWRFRDLTAIYFYLFRFIAYRLPDFYLLIFFLPDAFPKRLNKVLGFFLAGKVVQFFFFGFFDKLTNIVNRLRSKYWIPTL